MRFLPGSGQKMSSVDAAWLHMEDRTNLMVITAVMSFHEQVEFSRIKEILEDRFLIYDRFRQRVIEDGLGGPRWVDDDDFNLRAHLVRIGLPQPAGKEELEDLVSSLMSTPLDFTKPLWQFHFIDNYRGGSALIARIHHCIADGIALIRVLLSMTDASATPPQPKRRRRSSRRRSYAPGFWLPEVVNEALYSVRKTTGKALESGMEALSRPEKILSLASEGAGAAGVLARLASMSADPKTCFKGKLGSQKRCAWSEIMPLSGVKAFGKSIGATINDVLLAGVCGALRHYLIETGQQDIDGMNIRATVPVNLRPDGPPGEFGNRFGLVFLALPVGLPTRMERLRELKKRMDVIKRSSEAIVTFGVLNAIGMASADIESRAIGFFGAKATGVMTNVPGPREEIYMAGRAVRSMMFWVPQAARSYAGQVRLGVATDAGLVPNPSRIIEFFQQEMQEMIAGEE